MTEENKHEKNIQIWHPNDYNNLFAVGMFEGPKFING